jgi:hypothetical protein
MHLRFRQQISSYDSYLHNICTNDILFILFVQPHQKFIMSSTGQAFRVPHTIVQLAM